MYLIPGYVKREYKDNSIYLTSEIFSNKVKIFQSQYKEELEQILKYGCREISTELSHFLHEQTLLINEDEIKKTLMAYKDMMKKTLLLTIMPTEACNFRCPYCYENHQAVTMNEKTFSEIKKYIENQISKFNILQLNWFGGEPTLCKEQILEVGHFIKKLKNKYNFKFTSNMTTNGYLLDIDSFLAYYDNGIVRYQITLDGWEHDKTRPLVSGKGSLQVILDNLKAISSLPADYNFSIIIRHNILNGDEDYTWYDYIKELFCGDERFKMLIRPVGDWGGESVHGLNLLSKEHQNLAVKKHLDYLDKIGLKRANGEHTPFSKVCYANYPHSAVFRANGKIEKCTVCLDHPKNHLGEIDPYGNIVINQEINDLWTVSEITEKCYQCPSVLSCLNMKCKKNMIVDGTAEKECSDIMSDIY